MATRPQKPPFSRYHKSESGKERALATILTQRPDIVGERKLYRDTTALEHAKKLLAEDTTPKQKQQLKTAWDYGEDCYVKWERACAEFDKMQRPASEDYGDGKAGDRKRKRDKDKTDALNKISEDAKKSSEFLEEMYANYEKDPEVVAAELKALIDDESTRPAIEAIMRHGMCECSGAHGNLCAWVLRMWLAATRFRAEHGAEASSVLASMGDDVVASYLVDACAEIKVLRLPGFTDLCTGEKHEADPGVR